MVTNAFNTLTGPEVAFGPFRFYPNCHVLMREGTSVALGSRAREILLALVERAGEIVTKRELMDRAWPHTVVAEGALRVHITALRRALGETQGPARYLENIFGHGYRLLAERRQTDNSVESVTLDGIKESQVNTNVRLVQELYRRFQTGDIPTLLTALAEDVEWQLPRMHNLPFAGAGRGRVGIGLFFSRLAETGDVVDFHVEEFIAQATQVVALGRSSVRGKATDRLSFWAHTWRVAGGKITRFRAYEH
jgi:DNA-binding winged helix-turn-helix (wHTH) protein